jgi:predicted ATPase/DNA-binding SARP family transcriptional activator/Flp pilus assembly protein TadD
VVGPWRIEMLGGLAVVQSDRRITRFQTQKTGALLAYIALHPGKSHSRETLAEMLWPDGDPVAIRNRLNQAISSLRRQLHPPELGPGNVLVTDHHSIGINAASVVTDVDEFERDIRLAERAETDEERVRLLEQAVERYQGELLEGYFEEWIFSRRMHLAELHDQALQHLIRGHVALGSPEAAIEFARRRLELDPYDEAPHVILMRLYLRAGRPKSALKQFDDLVRALLQYDDEPSENALKYRAKAESLADSQEPQIDIDDDLSEIPAKRATVPQNHNHTTPTTNLPRVVNSFVGRETELDSIERLVERSRLISILGLGGFGKTRLAIEAGWRLLDRFSGNVSFVSFGAVEDPNDLAIELARTLLPGKQDLVDPLHAVIDRLSATTEPYLLILDNLEHVADQGALLANELLRTVAHLQIIVTSRIPLNVEGEALVSLVPLSLPRETEADLKALAENPAVSLFVERAQAVKADFQLTERTAEAIVALVNRLEGLPLAVELAASWARVLTPQQMLEQATSNVDQLASRRKDIQPRHRSLRAAFDGTYSLLDGSLKDVFKRLTFFTGGWSYEAAAHLCPDEDVFSVLQALEERSLIFVEPSDTEIRFGMLETIRLFGESLVSPDMYSEWGWLHAEYFLALAERPVMDAVWVPTIQADYGNCVAALRRFRESANETEFCRMVISMAKFWENRGLLAEGRERLTEALAIGSTIDPLIFACVKLSLARLEWLSGEFDIATYRTYDALETFQTYDSKADQIEAQFLLQLEAHRKGDYAEAKRLLRSNQEMASAIQNPAVEARCWLALGNAAVEEEDFDEAQRCYEQSLEKGRLSRDPDRIASALTNLGNLAIYRGHTDAARKWIEEALALTTQSENSWRAAMTLIVLARLENEVGRYPEAIQALIKAYWTAPDEKLVVWRFLLQLGVALAGLERTNDALRVFGFFEVYRDRIGEHHVGIEMRLYEQKAASIKTEANSEQFQIGRNMSFEEIETLLLKLQRAF